MAIRYPNGKKYAAIQSDTKKKPTLGKTNTYSNRGMTLEDDINHSNAYYLDRGVAVIHKKPTPVQIVDVHYPKRSAAVIKEAYFKQASTTDYNGVFNGHYIDFEAKETKNKTSFPLQNFHDHQITHMKQVLSQKGICFVLLRFSLTDEVFLVDAKQLIHCYENQEERKSIPKKDIQSYGHKISLGLTPRLDYLSIVQKIYLT
ncbi:Holliday junction resolvase RecU [Alkalicoccobacillus plakortidis]|uniref:Holliday junction resolvase RecU n=1 Tax=Alkalicoccobacillus plakortidis TaxID=444060 RepID=A0ABT0XEP8_9BACI|nr:Holliday junction resolvase RecU [Alkalicoccobacillus plakortidis]MCM2674378.1 Holliday junction resolvase RecU [Alkalicoccobacillus plakortidis]